MDVDVAVIPEILATSRCKSKVICERLLDKLSCDFTKADFDGIVKRCKNCRELRIVITHGTDTITRTAKLLAKAKLGKTIVLVGALVPYTVSRSDAAFNLGFAIASAQTLPEGIYITMNGTIFDGTKVKKNKATGIFESIK